MACLNQTCDSCPSNQQVGQTIPAGKKHKIGFISNPLSGWNKKNIHCVRELLKGQNQVCHREASAPSEIAWALDEFIHKDIDIVAVSGGDGTIHAVLTELFRKSNGGPIPLLTVLRSGTASMIARDVGLTGYPRVSLKRLLKWANGGQGDPKIVDRPIMKIETDSDRQPLYGMFFGAAAICQGIRFCLDQVHTKGLGGELAAGVTLARFLLPAARKNNRFIYPVPVQICLDRETAEKRDVLLILISTLERLFLGLRPFWGNEKTGPLRYTELGANPRRLLMMLPFLLRGRRHSFFTPQNGYLSRNIRQAEFVFSGSFAIDGELYTPDNMDKPVSVSNGGTASFLKL